MCCCCVAAAFGWALGAWLCVLLGRRRFVDVVMLEWLVGPTDDEGQSLGWVSCAELVNSVVPDSTQQRYEQHKECGDGW